MCCSVADSQLIRDISLRKYLLFQFTDTDELKDNDELLENRLRDTLLTFGKDYFINSYE